MRLSNCLAQKPMGRLLASKFFSLFAAIVYTISLAVVSMMPTPEIPGAPDYSDKIFHFCAYIGFTGLWFLFFYLFGIKNKRLRSVVLITIFIALFNGTIIEVMQGCLTTYRSADPKDMIANSAGILTCVLLIIAFRPKLHQLKSKF